MPAPILFPTVVLTRNQSTSGLNVWNAVSTYAAGMFVARNSWSAKPASAWSVSFRSQVPGLDPLSESKILWARVLPDVEPGSYISQEPPRPKLYGAAQSDVVAFEWIGMWTVEPHAFELVTFWVYVPDPMRTA